MSKQPAPNGISRRELIIGLGGLLAISAVMFVGFYLLGGPDKVREWVENAGAAAPIVFILLKGSTYVFAPLSGGPLKIAAGAVFGVGEGITYSVLGDTLGATINYWLARGFGRPVVQRLAGRKGIEQIDAYSHRLDTWRDLILIRLLLSSVYDFISYAAGLLRVPFGRFFVVTAIVGVIPTALTVLIGASFTGGGVFTPEGIIAVVLMVIGISFVLHKLEK